MSREATLKLINEVFGLAAFEQEIREIIGNTNWEVLALRTREARAALSAPAPSIDAEAVEGSPLLEWAVDKWNAEVKHRPLRNVHRRSLDDTWRQVIRWAGGDDEALCGPRHDDLVAANPAAALRAPDTAARMEAERRVTMPIEPTDEMMRALFTLNSATPRTSEDVKQVYGWLRNLAALSDGGRADG